MNLQESDNLPIIEDLPVDEARRDEVKGGRFHRYGIIVDDDYPGNPPSGAG